MMILLNKIKKIWQKFMMTTMGVLSLTFLLTLFFSLNIQIKSIESEFNQKVEVFSDMLSTSVAEPLWTVDKESIENMIISFLEDKEVEYIKLTDKKFGIIHVENKNTTKKIKISEKKVLHEDVEIGNLEIWFSKEHMRREISNTIMYKIVELLSILIGSGIVVFLIAKDVTEPIERMSKNMKMILKGSYKNNEKEEISDEIRRLEKNFNEMAKNVIDRQEKMKDLKKQLEKKVKERSIDLKNRNKDLEITIDMAKKNQKKLYDTNIKLKEAYLEINQTHDKLIKAGKMALLGQLVSGLAEELNDPIDLGLLASTHIEVETNKIKNKLIDRSITRKETIDYFYEMEELAEIISKKLNQAAKATNRFKIIAVDQSSGEKRIFKLKSYLLELVSGLKFKFKGKKIDVIVEGEEVEINSYPGIFSEIFTNLMINTINHGFKYKSTGTIEIRIKQEEKYVEMLYKDNGMGVRNSHIENIFEPFFKFDGQHEDMNLELNTVYTLVTGALNGKIICSSRENEGIEFKIRTLKNL